MFIRIWLDPCSTSEPWVVIEGLDVRSITPCHFEEICWIICDVFLVLPYLKSQLPCAGRLEPEQHH